MLHVLINKQSKFPQTELDIGLRKSSVKTLAAVPNIFKKLGSLDFK